MKIIIDNREHLLYDKIHAILFTTPNPDIQISFEPIPLGDILIKTDDDKTVLIIERKSILDLLSSIKDGRYDEQSYRLSHSDECCPHNIIYLIEGMFSILRPPKRRKCAFPPFFRSTISKVSAYYVRRICKKPRNWFSHLPIKSVENIPKERMDSI